MNLWTLCIRILKWRSKWVNYFKVTFVTSKLLLSKVTSGSTEHFLIICFKMFPWFLIKVTFVVPTYPTIKKKVSDVGK